jgi:FdhD protein
MSDVGEADVGVVKVSCAQVSAVGLEPVEDEVAREEAYEIRVGGEVLAITMRTPGHDAELRAGFLWAEGYGAEESGTTGIQRVKRGTLSSAACGVCGRDTIADLVERLEPVPSEATFESSIIASITERLRAHQPNFARTGGLHAAALLDASGAFLTVREDVGRHNAVDKVVGRAVLDGRLPLSEHVLAVSGRTSFEIVQKAVAAGIPALVAVSAPSSLAIELAARFRVLLVGFARSVSFKVYASAFRLRGLKDPAGRGVPT